MTPEDQARLRKRAEAATKGPWRSCRNAQRPYKHIRFGHDENYTSSPLAAQDADYIAAASPTVILALLDEVERGEKILDVVIERAEAALQCVRDHDWEEGEDPRLVDLAMFLEEVRAALAGRQETTP